MLGSCSVAFFVYFVALNSCSFGGCLLGEFCWYEFGLWSDLLFAWLGVGSCF